MSSPLSSHMFPHLCWVPTDCFPQGEVGQAPHPPLSVDRFRKLWIQATACFFVGHKNPPGPLTHILNLFPTLSWFCLDMEAEAYSVYSQNLQKQFFCQARAYEMFIPAWSWDQLHTFTLFYMKVSVPLRVTANCWGEKCFGFIWRPWTNPWNENACLFKCREWIVHLLSLKYMN